MSRDRDSQDVVGIGLRLVPAVGLAVGVIWALAQLALVNFYGDLGIEPAEAGWDTTTVLTRSASGLALLLLVGAIVWLYFRVSFSRVGKIPRRAISTVALGAGLLYAVLTSVNAGEEARLSTREGYVTMATPGTFPAITTSCVEVGPSAADSVEITPSGPVLLVGMTKDWLVVFDAKAQATASVPRSGRIVTTLGEELCVVDPTGERPGRSGRFRTVAGILMAAYFVAVGVLVWRRRRKNLEEQHGESTESVTRYTVVEKGGGHTDLHSARLEFVSDGTLVAWSQPADGVEERVLMAWAAGQWERVVEADQPTS